MSNESDAVSDDLGAVMEALDKLREVASAHDESLALESQYLDCRRVLHGDDIARRDAIAETDSAA